LPPDALAVINPKLSEALNECNDLNALDDFKENRDYLAIDLKPIVIAMLQTLVGGEEVEMEFDDEDEDDGNEDETE
jgi:hypothetical protein